MQSCKASQWRSDVTSVAQEIKSDIEDAIAKYNEATSRLAEAEKNKAQADQVREWKSTGELRVRFGEITETW